MPCFFIFYFMGERPLIVLHMMPTIFATIGLHACMAVHFLNLVTLDRMV